ncbi:MAG: hypothetical protein KBT00_00490 [Bacteroidales bacterium]|nr:hypothetical protein [Candidatus Cacconaster merdequi]
MNAYNKIYLDDAMQTAGAMMDWAVNTLGCPAEEFCARFLSSGVADRFSRGDVACIAGKSGVELAREVMRCTGSDIDSCDSGISISSPEYWAGWTLSYYQWLSALSFKQLSRLGLDMCSVISMFYPLHEADLSVFCERADEIVKTHLNSSPHWIKRLRKLNDITQKELSEISNVPLRLIRAYEQKAIDTSNAESRTIQNLQRCLKARQP